MIETLFKVLGVVRSSAAPATWFILLIRYLVEAYPLIRLVWKDYKEAKCKEERKEVIQCAIQNVKPAECEEQREPRPRPSSERPT